MNLTNDIVEQLKIYIMKSFSQSEKKHLLITGSKKSGKTTLLNEILKDEVSVGGVVTSVIRDDKIPPRYVILSDMNDLSINGIIAKRNKSATSLIPFKDTFEGLGVNILNKYIKLNIELIVIDEIGFLENPAPKYKSAILKCMEKKRVIFVIKKQSTPFIENLRARQDVYLVDIDDVRFFYKHI